MNHHPSIGALHVSRYIDTWLTSGPVALAYLGGTTAPVTLCDLSTDPCAQELLDALDAFLAKPERACVEAEAQVFADYINMGEACGFDELEEIATPADVWSHVRPIDVYVQRNDRRDNLAYVSVIFDCDWEEEHGLQLVFRQGKELVRVGPADGRLV